MVQFNRFVKFAILGFLLIIMVNTALAFGGRWHRGWYQLSPQEMIERRLERAADFLDLDDQQQQALRKIFQESFAKRKEAIKNALPIYTAFLEESRNEQFDENRLLGLIEQNREKRDEMVRFAIQKYAEFHAILNPQQKAKLVKVMEKIANWRRKRMQKAKN